MEDSLKKRQSYSDYLTTKTSKTNGFDTIEIYLVIHKTYWCQVGITHIKPSLVESGRNYTHKTSMCQFGITLIKLTGIW